MRRRLLKKYLSRIREIEILFPQETNGFPTNDIRRLADDCEYDEALEHAEPLLGRRWIDIDAEHWYNNFDSSALLTVEAIVYYLPSVMRFTYMEKIRKMYGPNDTTYYVGLTEDHYIYLFGGCNSSGDEVDLWREKRTKSVYEKLNLEQLKVVKNWMLFELVGEYETRFNRSVRMRLIDQAIREREDGGSHEMLEQCKCKS